MTKSQRISVRVEDHLKARVQRVIEDSGMSEPSLITALVKSVCDYWEAHKELTLPFSVIPKRRLQELEALEARASSSGGARVPE